MNQILRSTFSIITSTKTTLALLMLFAGACAWGTFLENDYGTPAAKAFIYGTWWFEAIMALLIVNFISNIKTFRLLRKEKRSLLFFHLGFIVILIGAFISRYTGFEGMFDVREGESKDYMLSTEIFMTVQSGGQRLEKEIKPTALTVPTFDARFTNGVSVNIQDFVASAEEELIPGDDNFLQIVVAEDNQRQNYYLEQGKQVNTLRGSMQFGTKQVADINFSLLDGILYIRSKESVEFIEMTTQLAGSFRADTNTRLKLGTLYQSGNMSFVVKDYFEGAEMAFKTTSDKKLRKRLPGKLLINVETDDEIQDVVLDYTNGSTAYKKVKLGDQEVEIAVGPKRIPLGFSISLKDFELIRYPGSTSPSSYSSYIEVQDDEMSFPFHIYMNNVLDYKGYRFFQASYDEDELGTVLSVNHDWWGTWVSYLGYFMMGLGMIWSLFQKQSRFNFLNRGLKNIKKQKAALTLVLGFTCTALFAQNETTVEQVAGIYPAEVTNELGTLLVQDMDGRIKPVNTLASELTRKLTGKTKYHLNYDSQKITLSSNQLFVAIHAQPHFWLMAPVISIDELKGKGILEQLGKESVPFITARDFFDVQGNYLLQDMVANAYNTLPAERTKQMEEVIKIDERFNILYQALTDSYLKIFPKPKDIDHKWYTDKNVLLGFRSDDSLFVKHIVNRFYQSCDSSFSTGDWSSPKRIIGYMSIFQQKYGKEIIPSEQRVKGELLYNKLNLFLHLFYSYWTLGLILLLLAIADLFYSGRIVRVLRKASSIIVAILFLTQTFNMTLRWYAGGYPPWSNGYEMIILVSWATVLFGIVFSHRTHFILPLASLFTGTLLFVAFLDWLNPEITNLVPVLKSYWLKIHVAIIVGSYAPLALSALLGFTALWMMITGKVTNTRLRLSLKEVTLLSEVSMTIGLYMLAIGTFLGGVWANESWGRYWGWDPKETWALISILVYAIVLHMRLIPAIKNQQYWFNTASVVAFFSIIMTSFGVNYYLSGLHSYAQGDPLPIPIWVFWAVGIVFITILVSFVRSKQFRTSFKE